MKPFLLLLAIFIAFPVAAQGIRLSAEQEMMLNQLPPAQRQQALDAIRQAELAQAATNQSAMDKSNASSKC